MGSHVREVVRGSWQVSNTCDRCGLKLEKVVTVYPDDYRDDLPAGWLDWREFEAQRIAPTWSHYMLLCPSCTSEYVELRAHQTVEERAWFEAFGKDRHATET